MVAMPLIHLIVTTVPSFFFSQSLGYIIPSLQTLSNWTNTFCTAKLLGYFLLNIFQIKSTQILP